MDAAERKVRPEISKYIITEDCRIYEISYNKCGNDKNIIIPINAYKA